MRKDARIRSFGSFVRRTLAQYLISNEIPWDREGFVIGGTPEGMFDIYFDEPKPKVDYKTDIMEDLPGTVDTKKEPVPGPMSSKLAIANEVQKIIVSLEKIYFLNNHYKKNFSK